MAYLNKQDQRDAQNRWYARNKKRVRKAISSRKRSVKDWIWSYKQGLKCLKCGESDPVCLQFHHRDPSEKDLEIALAAKNGWGVKRVRLEIAKCDVLCANCHLKVHASIRD